MRRTHFESSQDTEAARTGELKTPRKVDSGVAAGSGEDGGQDKCAPRDQKYFEGSYESAFLAVLHF